jgi:hypothetical protein
VSTLTATADNINSWVRLDLDLSDTLATHARVARVGADGSTTVVRYGSFTASLTAVASNSNQTFDSGTVTGWSTTTGITFVADTAQAHSGTWSMKMTPNGATATPYMESDKIAVGPTQRVQAQVWLFSTVGYTTGMSMSVAWYNAGGTVISTTSVYPNGAASLGTNTWTLYGSAKTGVYPTAPAGTAAYTIRINYAGTPANTVIVWADDARGLPYPLPTPLPVATYQTLVGGKITLYDTEAPLDQGVTYQATGYVDQGPLTSGSQTYDIGVVASTTLTAQATLLGMGWMWLKDPLVPANNLRVGTTGARVNLHTPGPGTVALSNPAAVFQGLDPEKRGANSTAFNVNNRSTPVPVTRLRSSESSQLFLITRTFADRDAVKQLAGSGGALLFQAPARYGVPDRYLLVGDEQNSRVGQDHRYPVRVFALPWVSVLAPPGPSQGVAGARWQDLCNHYTTWGALNASSGGLWDPYTRSVAAGGWGAPQVGGSTWTLVGTGTDFSVNGTKGVMAVSAVNSVRTATTGSYTNLDLYGDQDIPALATGAAIQVGLIARYVDASNYYRAVLSFGAAGTATLSLIKRVAAVETTLATGTAQAYTAGSNWRYHFSLSGTALKASAWTASAEPVNFQLSTTDAALAGPGGIGWYAILGAGNTNSLPVNLTFDNTLVVGSPTWTQILDRAVA